MGFIIFFLILIAVVLFVVGTAYVFRGFLSIPEAGKMVPKENLVRMRESLETAEKEGEQLRLQLDSMTLELNDTREKFFASQKNQAALETLKIKEREYIQQTEDLQKKIDFLAMKADQQARDALEEINVLLEESDGLKQALGDAGTSAAAAPTAADAELAAENARLSAEIEQGLAQIRQLEESLDEVRMSDDPTEEYQERIASLTEEKSRLMKGLQRIHAKITELEDAFANSGRHQQEELKEATSETQRLRDTIASLNGAISENEKKIFELQHQLAESRQQMESARQAAGSAPPVAATPSEDPGAAQELKRLKALNELLQSKEKRLQLELTKSRARTMGLEKICAEYKAQMKRGE